jgi:hypothetical protein
MGLRSLLITSALLAAVPLVASATLNPTNPPIARGGAPGLAILRPCPASQLKPEVTSNEGAMLHRELRITLTNVGASACAVDGYPAVRLLDALSHPRIAAESFSGKPRMFILAPDQQAAFRLRIATGDGTTTYLMVPLLAIIPPGDVKALVLKVDLPSAPAIDVTALLPAAEVK